MMDLQRASVPFCSPAEKPVAKKIEKTELADCVSQKSLDSLCQSMELSIQGEKLEKWFIHIDVFDVSLLQLEIFKGAFLPWTWKN